MRSILRTVVLFFVVSGLLTSGSYGQTAKSEPTVKPVAPAQTVVPKKVTTPVHRLAPNVLYKVDPFRELGKPFERHDVEELLAVDSTFEFAKDVSFPHDVWYLEFEFKPMRVVTVDIPQPNGVFVKKTVWYMVYKVKNPGKAYCLNKNDGESTKSEDVTSKTVPYRQLTTYQADQSYEIVELDKPISFSPRFSLECTIKEKDKSGNYKEVVKKYPGRYLPLALDIIRMRERLGTGFLTAKDCQVAIPPGKEYWGVVTWIDVDKTTTKFSVYVNGLTNAYHWKYNESASVVEHFKERVFECKVLKINFWRPADEYYETDSDFIYGQHDENDYSWIYLPPGT